MAGYLTAYIDRVNVGFAALTANKDLGSQWFSSASDLVTARPLLAAVAADRSMMRREGERRARATARSVSSASPELIG